MNKLISNNALFSHGRNAISFTFEFEEGNHIKITKVFFANNEIASLFNNQVIELDKLNVAESVIRLPLEDFIYSFRCLFNDTNLHEIIDTNVFFSTLERISWNSRENIEKQIDNLNGLFFGIHFDMNSQSFVEEEYKEQILSLLRFYKFNDYTKSTYNDFIEKPQLDEINDNEYDLYELRVYNVGQANCSALIKYIDYSKRDYKVLFVYDFGCDSRHKKNSDLNEMINKIDQETFILISHFHSDHFNNIASHLLIKTRRWIFPNCYSSSVTANRLFHVLLKVASGKSHSGTIYRFPAYFSFSKNISVSEYTGPALRSPIKNSLINLRSLVSTVTINNKKILIPSDATYEAIDARIKLYSYDYVLLAHHGCYYPNTIASKKYLGNIVKDTTIGIVQCGQNSYGHPDINHLNFFKNTYLMHNSILYDNKVKVGFNIEPYENFFRIKFK